MNKNAKTDYGLKINGTPLDGENLDIISFNMLQDFQTILCYDYEGEQVVEGLFCVAWINLSKTPWKTTTKMDAACYERVRIWEPIVKKQLLEATPNIVFYGNTWDASVINSLKPNINWQESFCTNTKEYIYKSDGGKQFRIYISQYRNTNKLLINGYHPELGNAAEWQADFIKNYINSQ